MKKMKLREIRSKNKINKHHVELNKNIQSSDKNNKDNVDNKP